MKATQERTRPSAKWLVVWTTLGVLCTVPGVLLLPTLPSPVFRQDGGVIALLVIGLFALSVAVISWWELLRGLRAGRLREQDSPVPGDRRDPIDSD